MLGENCTWWQRLEHENERRELIAAHEEAIEALKSASAAAADEALRALAAEHAQVIAAQRAKADEELLANASVVAEQEKMIDTLRAEVASGVERHAAELAAKEAELLKAVAANG